MSENEPNMSIGRVSLACRRGMLELDLILLPYCEGVYPHLPDEEQRHFIDLLSFSDQELFDMLIKFKQHPDNEVNQLVDRIRDYCRDSKSYSPI